MTELIGAKQSIKKFIAETSFANIKKIKNDTMIFREGIFDSMGFMTLITYLENNFQIQIKDTDLIEENFESVNAIYGFLERNITLNNEH
jgi:acyl carrier protein